MVFSGGGKMTIEEALRACIASGAIKLDHDSECGCAQCRDLANLDAALEVTDEE